MSYELRVGSARCTVAPHHTPSFIIHYSIVKAIIQAAIAALTALGVTSCSPFIPFLA